MARRKRIPDPVPGPLPWRADVEEWQGRVLFTPKHAVKVVVYAPASFDREFG